MSASKPDGAAENPLQKACEDYLAGCHAMVERLKVFPGGFPQNGCIASGPLPFINAWQQFADSLGIGPDRIFSHLAPALGATREYQQIGQRMLDLGVRFQRAYAELVKAGEEVSQQSLRSVRAPSTPAASVHNNPLALYDAWIDGAEEAYSQLAHGESFARLFGELCNILSGFKVERGKLLEALARHLDLPTRAEIDTLHRQVHELDLTLRRLNRKENPAAPKPRKTRKSGGS